LRGGTRAISVFKDKVKQLRAAAKKEGVKPPD
jgi:hypothetical protein